MENYRLVASNCGFSKLFEMLLYDCLIREVKPLLSPNQHGFLGGRSIATNLTCFTQFISDTIDKQGQIDVAYTDFFKGFDKINHRILLRKFSEFDLTLWGILSTCSTMVTDRQSLGLVRVCRSS